MGDNYGDIVILKMSVLNDCFKHIIINSVCWREGQQLSPALGLLALEAKSNRNKRGSFVIFSWGEPERSPLALSDQHSGLRPSLLGV